MASGKSPTFLKFLFQREHGLLSVGENCLTTVNQAHLIAEDKSAIPDINKACELSGHSRSTFLVSFSPDRTKVASTHGDHTVRVTELKTGKCTHILRGHPRTPWSVAFHPSSNDILATGCLGGEVRIWDLRGGGSEVWKSEQGKVIASLAFHPADQVLVIATNNELLFWDWSRAQPFASCKTNTDYEKVRWCKFDPFGHYLYTGIANKSTIQSDELDASFPELRSDSRLGDYRPYRDHYRQVADDISQRRRMPGSSGLLGAALFGDDEDRPQSPTHSTSLRDAQQYAAYVSQQSRRQQRLNTAPSSAAYRPSLYGNRIPQQQSQQQHFSRIEIGRVEGPSAPDFENTDDHMQQIHRIPNVYATGNSSSGRGLETLANAAEVVSHMDTVVSSSGNSIGGQGDTGAARTSQPFFSGTIPLPMSSLEPVRTTDSNPRLLTSHPGSSLDVDSFLDSVVSGHDSVGPGNSLRGSLPISRSDVTTRMNRQADSLIPGSGSLRGNTSSQRSTLLNGESAADSDGSTIEIPENTSSSFLSSVGQGSSSEVRSFFESFLSRENDERQSSANTDNRGTNNAILSNRSLRENLQNDDPLFSLPEFPVLENLASSSSRPSDQLGSNDNADQNSLDTNGGLTVQISEQSDAEDNPARAGLSGVGGNLWENFENNTLNIEIPNMTPNSDDSSSFSGPMRTPRNSADVNRPQQPQQVPSFPTMGLIRPVSPMRTSQPSSPFAMRYGMRSRAPPSFARLLDNTLQMAQNNVLESSPLVDDGDNRSTPSEPDPSSYSQLGSLSRPSSLSPSLETDLLLPTSDNTNHATTAISSASTESSRLRVSTASPSANIQSGTVSSHSLPRLDIMSGSGPLRSDSGNRGPLFSGPHSGSTSSQPPRGRNLMHLLETPFPVRSQESSLIPSDRVATDVPQPAAPSSFALPFTARNHNVRSSSSPFTTGENRPSLHRNRHCPPFCTSNCEICNLSTDRAARRLPSIPRYSPLSRPNSNPQLSTTVPTSSSSATATSSALTETSSRLPQRLASIIESEVRQAIDSIHARRISVSDTMRDLDNLQRNLADVPEWPLEEEDEPEVLRFTPVSREEDDDEEDEEEEEDGETEAQEGEVTGGGQDEAVVVDAMDTEISNNNNSSQSGDEQQDGSSSSRIQALNDLQQRLRERIEQLERSTAAAQSMEERRGRIENRVHHYSQMASQRQRERRQRMQRHLEALRRRHRASNLPSSTAASTARYTSFAERHAIEAASSSLDGEGSSRLRNLHEEVRNVRLELLRSRIRERRQWRALQRRNINQDFSYSRINEEALNQANEFQSVINRMPFLGNATEPSVSNSIVNLTHRVQRWDMSGARIPNISDPSTNVVIPYCKLHNDATADISQDGKLLAMFVPSNRNFPDDTLLGIFSLESHNLGQCLYTKSFDPNAISVSLSPLNNYVLVGLAVKRLQWVFSPTQMVAQIYKLDTQDAGEDSMKHICDLMHPCDLDLRMQVSVNSARWLPTVGEGVVYCTNRGDLHVCKPGWAGKTLPANSDQTEDRRHINTRQLIIQLLRINSPRTNNSATQTTTQGVRRSASTQTDSIPTGSDTEWDWGGGE